MANFTPWLSKQMQIEQVLFRHYLRLLAYVGILGDPSVQNTREGVWKITSTVLHPDWMAKRYAVEFGPLIRALGLLPDENLGG
jgi:hypothetical protein